MTNIASPPHPAGAEKLVRLEELLAAIADTVQDETRSARQRLQRIQTLMRVSELTAPDSKPNLGGLPVTQLKYLTAYVEENLTGPLQVQTLSALFGLSASAFSRAFKLTMGISPHKYLLHRRVHRAKFLMLTTDQTLADIALECGLADQAHLTRIFSAMTGDTPGRWRRIQRNRHFEVLACNPLAQQSQYRLASGTATVLPIGARGPNP